jgi:DNA-binding NarL/FixJ family response regulator
MRMHPADPEPPPVPAPGSGGEEAPPATAAPVRVLIVEDDFLVALLIEEAVQAAGMAPVGVASSPEEARRVCAAERPDFVTMDINLRGVDSGVELAGELLARHGVRSIYVSAFTDEARRLEAEPTRPLGWIGKPFSNEQLTAALKSAAARLRAD